MKKIIVIILMLTFFLTVGCSKQKEQTKEIVIAEQFGLAYAPLQIMKEKGYLSEALPDYEVKWVKLGNTAAIREAVLGESLDVGFLGIPPFLIGYDNGMEWGIFSGLSSAPLGLVSNDPAIKTLEDIEITDRIVLPQPGSIQHILLSMAAEKTFGQADYFDKQLVTMKHPDGMTALLSEGDVKLHYTSPPFLFEELKHENLSLVIDGNTCFGDDFTFIVGMTTKTFKEDSQAYNALVSGVEASVNYMKTHPEESIEILSHYYDYDKVILKDYVYQQGITYTTDVKGLETFITFMVENKLLKETIKVDDVLW